MYVEKTILKLSTFFSRIDLTIDIFILVLQPPSAESTESFAEIVSKRASMLETLLGLLNSAADIGVGPSLADLRTSSDLENSRWLKQRFVLSHVSQMFELKLNES